MPNPDDRITRNRRIDFVTAGFVFYLCFIGAYHEWPHIQAVRHGGLYVDIYWPCGDPDFGPGAYCLAGMMAYPGQYVPEPVPLRLYPGDAGICLDHKPFRRPIKDGLCYE